MPVNQIGPDIRCIGMRGTMDGSTSTARSERGFALLQASAAGAGEILKTYNAGGNASASSAPADFDPSDGSPLVGPICRNGAWANAVTLQPDGHDRRGGRALSELFVARYLPDGALDPGFGNGTGSVVLSTVGPMPPHTRGGVQWKDRCRRPQSEGRRLAGPHREPQ